jgi:UDP-N-acetylglucosamine diphosphorylase / glucose-1-phosphate thymidylyltransferase / UDP-N-acetylgalactosamine diphosphorylase / glucosamine-1-phosphate N-acetyltransferase / galactosamine-1-phosphate N-acetyltransferase
MHVVLFEDELVDRLYPATLARPAFTIGCGSYSLVDLASRLCDGPRAIVRPHLCGVLAADCPVLFAPIESGTPLTLFLNARLVPAVSIIERLKNLASSGRQGLVRTGNSVAAVLIGPDHAPPPDDNTPAKLSAWIEDLRLAAIDMELPLLEYPHELIRWNMQILRENLVDRISRGDYREIADGLFAAPGARLGQYCVIDAANGPVVLEHDAAVGPFCYLRGPVHIGAHCRVIEHAAIKDFVALGHNCKIGGEVEDTIIEPFTNKQHHGFIGHSYLGSWINLGAGTSNSDLKNTYGTVNMEYNGIKVDTGMQLMGCVVGDYAKTAINTGIFTGKTIGACSMVYGFVTTNVPSFSNYARSFGQVTEAPPEVMFVAQARMFARRNVKQRPCDIQLIRDMYALTRHEGRLPNQPPSL